MADAWSKVSFTLDRFGVMQQLYVLCFSPVPTAASITTEEFEGFPQQRVINLWLDKDSFNRSDFLAKRSMLFDTILAGLRQLFPERMADLDRATRDLDDELGGLDPDRLVDCRVTVERDTLAALSYPRWPDLTEEERLRIGTKIRSGLQRQGRSFEVRLAVPATPFIPPTVVLSDMDTRVDFALTPAGVHRPATDTLRLASLNRLRQRCLKEDAPEDAARIEQALLRLAAQPDQAVSAMLVAIEPILPGHRAFAHLAPPEIPPIKLRKPISGEGGLPNAELAVELYNQAEVWPYSLRWLEAWRLVRQFQWGLPTPSECEWLYRGGLHSRFCWEHPGRDFKPEWYRSGHAPITAICLFDYNNYDDRDFSRRGPPVFPEWNSFLLRKMLGIAIWCPLRAGAEGPELVGCGWPFDNTWDSYGEWLELMSDVELTRYLDECSPSPLKQYLRPVLRLTAE
jgi:hypothetical protein